MDETRERGRGVAHALVATVRRATEGAGCGPGGTYPRGARGVLAVATGLADQMAAQPIVLPPISVIRLVKRIGD